MDTIDVTSPEFSLGGFSELNDVLSDTISLGNVSTDYTMYIYIGVIILIGIISYFIYKFYLLTKIFSFVIPLPPKMIKFLRFRGITKGNMVYIKFN